MDAGRKAYEKGQYDKALREYLKIVKEDPKDVRVWLKIGDLYTKKRANTEATETYMKVAAYYSDQGFFKKSVAVYKQILRVDPRLVEVNLKLAELYRQLGLLQDAMQHFEMVAAFFHREGKTQEALATLRQLVDLDPENVATRIKLAEVYSKEQMVPEAVREFTTTCDFLRKNGRQEDFLKVAERLLFHEPDNLDLCRELATLYLKRNDPRRALAKLQICFKADQSDPSVLALLAQAFQRLDQKGKTVSVLKELARVHAEAGRAGEAREVHEKILQYVPADPDSLTFLGRGARPSALADKVQLNAEDVAVPPLRSRSPIGRSTGSMPIVSGADDYADPVYSPPAEDFLDSSLLDSDVSEGFPREDSFVADLELLEEEAAYDADSSVETQENADEIVKILTETDVYVKYGLNQKAVDHLRRIFELDERNIEARERLQSILIEEGRVEEGIAELLILAEHSLTRPDQALRYLLQILEIDSNNAEAINFAARHRIPIGQTSVIGQGSASDYVNEDSFTGGTPRHLNSEDYSQDYDDGEEGELDFDDLAFDEMPMGGHLPGQVASHELPNPPNGSNGSDTRPGSRNRIGGSAPVVEPSTLRVGVAEVESSLSYGEFEGELDFALNSDDDLGFDREAATAFDAGFSPAPAAQVPDFIPERELVVDVTSEVDIVELDSSELIISEDTGITSTDGVGDFAVPTLAQSSSNFEDDLDEADFFLSQGLFEEALEIMGPLLAKHPTNPLVLAKHEEISSGMANGANNIVQSSDVDSDAFAPAHLDEDLANPIGEDLGPSVVLENPVDDNDADTHFDLGLAYKEMGLLSEAIVAFEKVLQAPSKAVQGRLMAGLCHRELGSLSEAISQFKAGLYESQISSSEKYSLYYEIGITYEGLQDPQEAMYYYEMVLKKDPEYRNIADRVAGIKGL